MKIYIQTNDQQRLASKIAMASFIKFGFNRNNIFFLDINKNDFLKSFFNCEYIRNGSIVKFKDDLQSFTLLRFLAPEMNNYRDKILIIDPDVFACKDPNVIFDELGPKDQLCCTFYDNHPRSEVMLLNASKVKWKFKEIVYKLFKKEIDYKDLINLSFEKNRPIKEISKKYNSYDEIKNNTVLLHTTQRITQPWKEGLKIDFEKYDSLENKIKNSIKKILGMRYNKNIVNNYYIRHPEQQVIDLIKKNFNYAFENNIINQNEIDFAIKKNFLSKKFIQNH